MKNFILWLLAFLITLFTAVYQRLTGPTYPVRGKTHVANCTIKYTLARTHETHKDYEIKIAVCNPEITGHVLYKRFKTKDPWTRVQMKKTEDNFLIAYLPSEPPAGKLAYKIILTYKEEEVSLSGEDPVVIRFKGSVPSSILIPHIIFIFLAMLFSTRAGLEALRPQRNPRKLVLWTTALLFVGGMIFGPLVQHFAFGALWTGFPLGYDLTDNKTLIALIGWVIALIAGRHGQPARKWVLGASILLVVVFLIPHSLLGSELKY
ncbi:MAG: hypothetical protein IBX60_00400 [Candidatus Aminicenantes bacterium]|nr:hypothetical protein [Candidatus Aminicenantes bacterium]